MEQSLDYQDYILKLKLRFRGVFHCIGHTDHSQNLRYSLVTVRIPAIYIHGKEKQASRILVSDQYKLCTRIYRTCFQIPFKSLFLYHNFSLQHVSNLIPTVRQYKAMVSLKKSPLIKHVLEPSSSEVFADTPHSIDQGLYVSTLGNVVMNEKAIYELQCPFREYK